MRFEGGVRRRRGKGKNERNDGGLFDVREEMNDQ